MPLTLTSILVWTTAESYDMHPFNILNSLSWKNTNKI